MSAPLSVVLVAGALVSSPALWLLHAGTITADDALRRVLICLVACWVAISVVTALITPRVRHPALPQAAAPGGPAQAESEGHSSAAL